MSGITPQEVLEAIREMLEKRKRGEGTSD